MASKIGNIDEFKLCNNDEDRVKLMLNDFGEFLSPTEEFPYVRKSPGESEKFRHSGNLLLNSILPNLEQVLKLYAKSILYAPPGSEQLSLAYANRSVVLFKGKYYEECLEDISRALETGYPDSLKPKLLIRRVTCNYALTGSLNFETNAELIEARALIEKLPATNKIRKMVEATRNNPEEITSIGRQAKKTHHKYQPEIKKRNSHLPGASDAIALRYSEKFGRHLVATRNINSGEVLLIERTYATIVDDEWIYCICSHCARRTWNGIPCDYCIHAMFCSAECKRAAWEEYHNVECEILGFGKDVGIRNYTLMAVRITVKAIKEAGSLEALRKRLKELDSVKASDVEIPINPNSYETFYIMSEYPERQELEHLMTCSSFAGILTYFFAVRTDLFGMRVRGNLRVVKDSEKLLFAAGLMLRNMRIAENRMNKWKVEDKTNPNEKQIFTLTPLSSFLNSRCYDPAELLRCDKDIILVTNVPITKGDQVFTHYCEDYKNVPRDIRRKFLKDRWQFDCNCLACKDNWSASTPTHWEHQDLPPRIAEEVRNEIIKFDSSNHEETGGSTGMISLKEEFCGILDFSYPRVKKPCLNVELLLFPLNNIDMVLCSMIYSRFGDKF